MSYRERNLRALYRRHPEMKNKGLDSAAPPPGFELRSTPGGLPTAILDGSYLHSRYDPGKEAAAMIASETGEDSTAAVFYGFGLGYLVEAFTRAHPGKPLVVIEQDPALFAQALGSRDLVSLLEQPHICWQIGEEAEAVMMSIESLPLHGLRVLRLRPLVARQSSYFDRIDLLLASLSDQREININTLKRFGRLWVRNLLLNLELFALGGGVSLARDRFRGLPALVLAAGPSLDAVLPHLEHLRRRLLILAVDTSLRFCRERGVEPDFLVTVDPQYWNSRHLDWQELGAAILVSEPSAHPRIFRLLAAASRRLLFVSSFFPLGRYFEELTGEKGLIGAGGSVATTAWDLARFLGCSRIFMAGLDLGFPGKQTHSRGAFFEETMHSTSDRFQPVEKSIFRYLHQAAPAWLNNNSGGLTLTDRRMLLYKWWFENQMKQQSRSNGPQTYSLSAEGVRIDGMPFLALEELLELPEARDQIQEALRSLEIRLTATAPKDDRGNLGAIALGLGKLADELEHLQALARRGIDLCHTATPRPTRELEALDREILSVSSRQIAGFLFQSLVRRILDNPAQPRTYEQALSVSEQLYRELQASASYQLELVARTRERLKENRNRR